MGKSTDEHMAEDNRSDQAVDMERKSHGSETAVPAELISAGSQHLQRRLGGKEIQLFAVGGAIGTCRWSCGFANIVFNGADSVAILSSLRANGRNSTQGRTGQSISWILRLRNLYVFRQPVFW